jgi:hypothetical protein
LGDQRRLEAEPYCKHRPATVNELVGRLSAIDRSDFRLQPVLSA